MQSVLLVTDAALNKPSAVDVVFITGVCLCVCSVLVFVVRGVTVLWENFQHCQCFCSAMEEPIFTMNWPSIPFQGWLGPNSDSLMTPITTFCLALHSDSSPRSLIGRLHVVNSPHCTPAWSRPLVPSRSSSHLVWPPFSLRRV